MAAAEQIAKLLGGEKVLKKAVRSDIEFVPLLRKGLPVASLEAVTRELELSLDAAAESLGLALRTIARRKQENKPLDLTESERVLRMARTLAHAIEVLGSVEKARRWMRKDNRALGNASPLSLLDTDVGAEAVDDVLTRVEHGVYG